MRTLGTSFISKNNTLSILVAEVQCNLIYKMGKVQSTTYKRTRTKEVRKLAIPVLVEIVD